MTTTTQRTDGRRRFVCSWSGGKDSCLALYRCMGAGWVPARLLTMLTEDGCRTRSHGLLKDVVRAQAESIGVPLCTRPASWTTYEEQFTGLLMAAAEDAIQDAVFGDIDLEDHRVWEERVCANAGMTAHLPLWQTDRIELLSEFWEAGFETRIVVVRADVLGPDVLGTRLDRAVAEDFAARGIDPCGENGEFHTVVTDGPIFGSPIALAAGEKVLRDGCWVQDLQVTEA